MTDLQGKTKKFLKIGSLIHLSSGLGIFCFCKIFEDSNDTKSYEPNRLTSEAKLFQAGEASRRQSSNFKNSFLETQITWLNHKHRIFDSFFTVAEIGSKNQVKILTKRTVPCFCFRLLFEDYFHFPHVGDLLKSTGDASIVHFRLKIDLKSAAKGAALDARTFVQKLFDLKSILQNKLWRD